MLHRGVTTAFALVLATVVALPAAAGAGSSDDQQIADDSALTAEDVPVGFVQGPAGDDEESPARGPRCTQITKASKELNRVPNREVSFRQGRSALINNQVSVFETPKAAKAVFAAYSGKRAPGCFEQGFEESYAKQLGPGAEVEVNLARYQPDLGDASAGYELEVGIAAEGETQVLYVNLEIAREGRAIDAFGFIYANELFPSDDIVAVTEAGMGRLEQAL